MEFKCLTRRQLQALCKRNKIPANMTNVAMADALSALDYVEGIEDIVQQQSPEKGEAGSPKELKTVTKTSTRSRKPPEESGGVVSQSRSRKPPVESGGVVSQSRSMISRKLVDDDSVEDEKKDMAAAPAVAGSRRGAPAAASRKKVEAPSVQRAYSTRRSVRLVEKQMSDLCLGESKKITKAIKIDDELSSEMTESDVKGANNKMAMTESDVKGANNKMETSEKNVEELNEIDEVTSSEISAQLVATADAACIVYGNEVTGNCVTDTEASENGEKDTAETGAEGAVGDMANADAEKEMEIVGDILSDLGDGEDEEEVKSDESQVGNGGDTADTEASENVENDTTETCAEGAEGEMANADADADAEKEMIVGDILSDLGDGEDEEEVKSDESQVSNGESDVPVKWEVDGEFLANLDKEISNADADADSEKQMEIVGDILSDLGDGEDKEEVKSDESQVSNGESDVPVKGEVDGEFVANLEKEISIDGVFHAETIDEVSFKTPADIEKAENYVNEEIKTETEACKHETETCILSTSEEVAIEAPALESPLPAVEKEEIGTTFQVDECDHDADSMTCQMGSPFHSSDNMEGLIDDSNPLDSAMSTVDSVEQVVDGELFEDKVEVLSGTTPKLATVELKLDTEMPVSEETLELPPDATLPLKSADLEVEHLQQQTSIKEQKIATEDPNKENIASSLMTDTEMHVSDETLELPSDASLPLKSADPEVEHSQQQAAIKMQIATEDPNKENNASSLMTHKCFKAPKTPLKDKSLRSLQKMLKAMTISTTNDKAKEAIATKEIYKHQGTPRPRQALKTLPDNTGF